MNSAMIIFKAHRVFVTLYYILLIVWTSISVPLLISKSAHMSYALIGMIAFVIFITWHWSLGLVHGIELENDEIVRLKRVRGDVILRLDDFSRIEAPPSRIDFGFIRLRLANTTLYAFFYSSEPLKRILATIRKQSPGTQFVKFSPAYFKA